MRTEATPEQTPANLTKIAENSRIVRCAASFGTRPPECRRFSHIRKHRRRDRTGWLGCQDSNLGMAESKSTCFAFDFKDHSKKSAKFDPFPFNRLGADSECAAHRAVRAHSPAGLFHARVARPS